MSLPREVRIVEVGPRDGLQNEAAMLAPPARAALIGALVDAGLRDVEAGAFVSPRAVPQMAGSDETLRLIGRRPGVRFPVLVPNLRGLDDALAAGAREIALFASATESFSRANLGCTVAESLDRYGAVAARAKAAGLDLRGYVSCALVCPYEGATAPEAAVEVAVALHRMGCREISLGDTIGAGTPSAARRLVERAAAEIGVGAIAVHFHDTYGQALANAFACLEVGVAVVDASVAGLGGCPSAPGAGGNLATEDAVYMLRGMGIETGVDLDALRAVGRGVSAALGRASSSRAAIAMDRRAAPR